MVHPTGGGSITKNIPRTSGGSDSITIAYGEWDGDLKGGNDMLHASQDARFTVKAGGGGDSIDETH
ncbi:MAG: hypothetical protein GY798_09270 [Hyphomicrobiales bacterium]|nr:hypothetical protein [Hyphomicrobiales bacterium]